MHSNANLRANEFRDQWVKLASVIPVEVKDRIALVYINKALRLGTEVAQKFSSLNHQDFIEAYRQVGAVQAGIPDDENAVKEFWLAINPLFPEPYSPEDLDFLVS